MRRRSAASPSARHRWSERDGSARRLGIDDLWIKDDTRNPTLSFKDRAVAVAAARAVELRHRHARLRLDRQPRRRDGGRGRGARACPPTSSFPPTSSPPRSTTRSAYGATVVPIDGTYDDVNRLCLEIADETGWGFVNVNLRPFYAEGSKTLAFEIAEQLGWRSPDVIVAPIASGAMFTKLAKGFDELAEVGLIERTPIRFVGGQPAGCAPGRDGLGERRAEIVPVRDPDTIVRSLAIGNPADGRYAVELARASGGSIEAIDDETTAARSARSARLEGIFAETAGGVTRGRGRRGATARRDPRRRRGRRAPDRQRAQDARRATARARRIGVGTAGHARPCRADPARA